MKLYHVSQKANGGYDTYSDFVVCCETRKVARNTNPSGGKQMTPEDWSEKYSAWAPTLKDVKVKYVGEASKSLRTGIVCVSFHAG